MYSDGNKALDEFLMCPNDLLIILLPMLDAIINGDPNHLKDILSCHQNINLIKI